MDINNEMNVQWFPGHMAKTRRLIKEAMPLIDAVAEITDARVPFSSRNPELDSLAAGKPRIILMNKSDLADSAAVKNTIKYFERQGVNALAVDCKTGKGLEGFRPLVRRVLANKIEQNEKKGMAGKSLRIMVVGIPNTGKSSFINKMAGKNRAMVADKPGVTRQNNWFPIGSGIELLDTPGVLWPKFEDPQVGLKLAFVGSVKDQILDIEELAMRLLEILNTGYPEKLAERYKLSGLEGKEGYELLELLARKRGMLISGGQADTERAAVMLLDEYRGGKLGRLSLENSPK